ncbi:hypothetical protein MBM_02609 [Drepanopeziza brunnea f. sp. 'multigermtubi' MB_m1]|uniref:Uncharacterized protein n=1 Tax=Marssonina brunnea f. sp. multigermtubi (strain MB_m1) TaxID=1072389 RepID=K1X2X0_MARBU|nr:uncharacterized protein MBM_02609 [Drepanopeziza brunnea f. sp. 'multigermtubi' MB_m1]EKD19372.1 hypothetical protein MBM_02609 [Drepanopeziza brunnea f. sp. 'multigermtubi' MB_m1]
MSDTATHRYYRFIATATGFTMSGLVATIPTTYPMRYVLAGGARENVVEMGAGLSYGPGYRHHSPDIRCFFVEFFWLEGGGCVFAVCEEADWRLARRGMWKVRFRIWGSWERDLG